MSHSTSRVAALLLRRSSRSVAVRQYHATALVQGGGTPPMPPFARIPPPTEPVSQRLRCEGCFQWFVAVLVFLPLCVVLFLFPYFLIRNLIFSIIFLDLFSFLAGKLGITATGESI